MLFGAAQATAAVQQGVQRQPHRKIAAQGGVDRNQRAAHRLLQGSIDGQNPVDNRLAVFALANLEIGRVARGFNKVAFRIDMKQPVRFAGDLPAEQQVAVEVGIAAVLLIAAVALNHLLQGFTDQHRRVV